MNYEDALSYIHSTPKFSRVLGNDLLRKLLNTFSNPQNNLKYIHIAGTNGKGSTAAMTASVLSRAGYKTGLFTSPFIERFNERIEIDGNQIPDHKLAELTKMVKEKIEEHDAPVSEFALICTIAFLYFSEQNCDIVVLETGLGGRLDATNVIENTLISVITSIGYDHTEYLGDTLDKITSEKCGIIKDNVPVILYPKQEQIVFDTVKKYCDKKFSTLIIPDIPETSDSMMSYKNNIYALSLKGSYQIYNASVVIEIISYLKSIGFDITHEDLKYGLKNTLWAARFEFLRPNLIVDGSHNPDGINALKSDLNKYHDITLVCAMMRDKDYLKCIKTLSSITTSVIVTEINMPRCESAVILAKEFEKYGVLPKIIKNPTEAVNTALSAGNTVCVTGSLYLAGYIRTKFNS